MFNFYSNSGFLKLYEDAVQALDDYAGKQLPFDEAFLLEQLRQYAFVLTPRMCSRLEILLIMFLLLDPNLHYLNIGQKSPQVEEEMQNRWHIRLWAACALKANWKLTRQQGYGSVTRVQIEGCDQELMLW